MGARPLLAGFVVCGLIVLSACAEEPAMDVSTLRIAGEQEQLEESLSFARLSPDGERMLYNGEAGTCVRRLDGSGERCVDHTDAIMDLGAATWSPDSTRVAFTEPLALDYDPDVWVLDVESGRVRNLTDDGVDGFDASEKPPEDAMVDVLPSWTSDGERILFARHRDDATIALVSMPAAGGEVTRIRTVDGHIRDLMALAWSGDTAAWALGMRDGEVVRMAGTLLAEPTVVLRSKKNDLWALSFSPDGEYLLIDSRFPSAGRREEAWVVPATGGDAKPVAPGKVTHPTWAPEGHALAYLELPDSLLVVAEPGGNPRKLRTDGTLGAPGDVLSWAPASSC